MLSEILPLGKTRFFFIFSYPDTGMVSSPRRRERSPILHANVTSRVTTLLLLEFILR